MGLNKKRHTKAIVIAIVLSICAYVLVPFVTTPFEKNYTIEVENQDRMIALTFDDGPGDYTMQLLNGLNAEGIKASFFLLGKKIEGKEDVVKKMQSDGHLIGIVIGHHYHIGTRLAGAVRAVRAERGLLCEVAFGTK